MDNTIQSMHEMIEAMDEHRRRAKPDAASITHVRPVRHLRTLDQILDKRKDAIKSNNEMFLRTFHRVELELTNSKICLPIPKSS